MNNEYEESLLSKSLPTKWVHECFKILDWKWFNSKGCVGCVLTWDLSKNMMRGFIGSPKEMSIEKEAVNEIVDYGASLPSEISTVIFLRYFCIEEVNKNLSKDFRLFLKLLEILDEK